MSKETYRNGGLHGVCKQWRHDGQLLITWTMVNGTGLDLWCSDDGTLAEENYYPRKGERGYQRAWTDDGATIFYERYFGESRYFHGIWREWRITRQGPTTLRRGFPHYYVKNRKVTKRQYIKACQLDPILLPFRPEDDDPHRELPAEYLAQRKA